MSDDSPDPSLADTVRALRDPVTYPDACATVELIETHFACVFLAGDFAYKLKKPVLVERMDFRDIAARERNCREELRLNRRLAPQVYLDVVPLVVGAGGLLQVSGSGILVDWLVKMRRLPARNMLDSAIKEGAATASRIEPVALLLARFYRDQCPVLLSGVDYLARLHERNDDTREQLLAADLRLDTELVAMTHQQQRAFLLSQPALVQTRALDGRIVEGHGDLRPEHVFLGSENGAKLATCVIDSLEFDRDLRIFDPAEELAFLALECDRLQAEWVGREFVRVYQTATQDEFAADLFSFYRTQRALTRAKITAWHVRDPQVRDLADWRALALSYLHTALQPAQVGY